MSQTQTELLEVVLRELAYIKKDLPNGQFKQLMETVKDLKTDVSEIKFKLLNPENGVIVKTNKNTEDLEELERELDFYKKKIFELDDILQWKQTVTKALWIIFTGLVGLILQITSMTTNV